MDITRIGFIGAGNVAGHLVEAFVKAGLEIPVIASRHLQSSAALAQTSGAQPTVNIGDLSKYDLDLVVIAVPDSAIEAVAAELGQIPAAVVHTSGAVPVDSLSASGSRTGVFYPLQTFTKGVAVDMNEVPVCLHASDPDLLSGLRGLAATISGQIYEVDDDQRKWLHLAAVMINNNINHLLARVEDLVIAKSMDRNILAPLLKETIRKAGLTHPRNNQTGPALRGDESTRQAHLALLRKFGDDRLIELYTYFWRSIQHYYNDDISR